MSLSIRAGNRHQPTAPATPSSNTKIDANLKARFGFTGLGYTLVDQVKEIRHTTHAAEPGTPGRRAQASTTTEASRRMLISFVSFRL